MKKSRDNFYSADERLFAAFGRLFLNFINLEAFYSTTIKSIEFGKSRIEQEWREGAQKSFGTPEFEKLVKNNPLMQGQDFLIGMSQALANRSVRLVKQTVESAALVFAHSLLDDAISECCCISFLASPKDWYPLIEKRKVELGVLETTSSEDVFQEIGWQFVHQMQRESMVKRLQLLNRLCVPRLDGQETPTAWLKEKTLDEFDDLRHRIIHGRYFSRPIRAIEDQLYFAKWGGFSLLMLVWQAYGLLDKDKFQPKSDFTALRLCAVLRREFPEFVELMEQQVKLRQKSR